MSDYLDASALVAVLLREPARDSVQQLLQSSQSRPAVSSFCLGECSAAITGLVATARKTEVEATALLAGLDQWIAASAIVGEVLDTDISEAARIVRRFDLKLRLPDAIHVATARRMGLRLVTLDRRMATAARMLGVACINPAETSV